MECDLCGGPLGEAMPGKYVTDMVTPKPSGLGYGFTFKRLCRNCRSHLYAAVSVVVERRKGCACQPTN